MTASNTAVVALALAGASMLSAQEVWHSDSIIGQREYITPIVRLGDVNGDGWDDIVELVNGRHGSFTTEVWIISGADGSMLSYQAWPPYGFALAPESLTGVGDMNGDGFPDYSIFGARVLGSGNLGIPSLEIRSGLDHHVIWSAATTTVNQDLFGEHVAGQLDVDGDGLGDIVVSAQRLSPLGAVIVFDHWGNELYRILNTNTTVVIGADLAPLGGDLDGDGCDDFLTAGPGGLPGANTGAVVVVSGRTGAYLRVSYGARPGDNLLEAIPCGDLDHDGVLDYAGGGPLGFGAVTTFSGATGLPIHSYYTTQPYQTGGYQLGHHMSSGFDVDQDGVNDIVTMEAFAWARLLSGRDGTILYSLGSNWRNFGDTGVAEPVLLAPPPGEKYPLLVYTSVVRATQMTVRLVMARTGPPGVSTFGSPDSSIPGITARMGLRDLDGPQIRCTLSLAPPGAFAAFVVGFSNTTISGASLPLPLDSLGLAGVTLLTSTDLSWTGWAGTTGMDAGYVGLDVHTALSTTGSQLYGQWLWLDPTDWSRNGSTAGHAFRIP